MGRNVIVAALCAAWFSVPAAAQEQPAAGFKRNVIQNCAEALLQLQSIPPEEHAALVPYLIDVLKLDLAQMRHAEQQQQQQLQMPSGPGLPHPVLRLGDLDLSFDPKLESTAKECAVLALERMGPPSVAALPELVRLALHPHTEAELRDRIDRAIGLLGSRGAPAADRAAAAEPLVELAGRAGARPAENALLLLLPESRDAMVAAFTAAGPERRSELGRAVLFLDPEGEHFTEPLRRALVAPDRTVEEAALIVLSRMQAPECQTIDAVLARLNDPHDGVRTAATAAAVRISKRLPSGVQCAIGRGPAAELLFALRSAPPSAERTALEGLFRQLSPGMEDASDRVLELLTAPESAQRITGAALVTSASATDRVFARLTELLYDDAPGVQPAALGALTRLTPERRAQALPVLFKALKRLPSEGAPARTEFLLAAAELFAALPAREGVERGLSYLFEALSIPSSNGQHPAQLALLRADAAAVVSGALKLLKQSGDPAVQRRIVELLDALDSADRHVALAVLPLLTSPEPELSAAAASYLTAHAGSVRKELETQALAENDAALAVLGAGEPSPEVAAALGKRALASCADAARFFPLLPPSAPLPDDETKKLLARCVAEEGILSPAFVTGPYRPEANEIAAGIERAAGARIEGPLRRTIAALAPELLAAEPLREELRDLLRDEGAGEGVRCEALLALAVTLPEDDEPRAKRLVELGSPLLANGCAWREGGGSVARLVAERFPESEADERRVLFRTMGFLGPDAPQFLDELGKAAQLPELAPETRYEAAVALARLVPELPAARDALVRVMRGSQNAKLLEEEWPESTLALIESIAREGDTALERTVAAHVLARRG